MANASRTDIAAQFVVAYYSAFVYNSATIKQFYSSSAVIFRSHKTPITGVPIEDVDPRALALPLQERAELNIAAYSVLELDDNRITVAVTGFLEQLRRYSFAQNFILEEKEGRVFVVGDSLHVCDDQTDFAGLNFVVAKNDEVDDDGGGRLRKKARRAGG
jgi:hypothetical protein